MSDLHNPNGGKTSQVAENSDSEYSLTLGQIARTQRSTGNRSPDMFATSDSDLDELLSTATFDPSGSKVATKGKTHTRAVHFAADPDNCK